MDTRVKIEIEPALKEAVEELSRHDREIQGNKDRIMLVDTTLTENLSDGFQILNEKVDDMAQGMDIATILNGLAAEAGSS